jgi:hypothetical protein
MAPIARPLPSADLEKRLVEIGNVNCNFTLENALAEQLKRPSPTNNNDSLTRNFDCCGRPNALITCLGTLLTVLTLGTLCGRP